MAVTNGSIRNDNLPGTAGDDTINGLGGDDTITGVGGNDLLSGDAGDDVISGGLGSDTLFGGDGDDELFGSTRSTATVGHQTAAAPDGNDILVGGEGNDTMWGGAGGIGDTFTGNDTFYVGGGNNAVAGGDGIDTVVFDLPRRSYTITPGLVGFPTDRSTQANGFVLTDGTTINRVIEVENLQFLDGRIVRDPNDPIAQVARLYTAALNRAPDPSGLNFWASAIGAGVPISQLASQIGASAEFQTRFNAPDNTGYVQQLYRNALGREADADGLNYWLGRLNGGTTRGDVLVAFAESAENKARTAPLIQAGIYDQDEGVAKVARLYDTAFNRLPDLAGLTSWRNALATGSTIDQVAQGFTNAQEFINIYGGPATSPDALVDALYRNTLNREPDPGGKAFFVQELQSGAATRAQVVLSFSESQEHILNTVPDIEGGVHLTG